MTKRQRDLAENCFNILATNIRQLTLTEMMFLRGAYSAATPDSSFDSLPDPLKDRLLTIALQIRSCP